MAIYFKYGEIFFLVFCQKDSFAKLFSEMCFKNNIIWGEIKYFVAVAVLRSRKCLTGA